MARDSESSAQSTLVFFFSSPPRWGYVSRISSGSCFTARGSTAKTALSAVFLFNDVSQTPRIPAYAYRAFTATNSNDSNFVHRHLFIDPVSIIVQISSALHRAVP